MHDVAVDVGKTVIAALLAEGQAAVVQAETMENRCVQIVNVNRIAGDVVAIVVGLAVGQAALDPGSGQSD